MKTKACYNSSSIFNQKLHHPKTALSSSNSKIKNQTTTTTITTCSKNKTTQIGEQSIVLLM
jgi:hypothetical protein